jgi:hypothetical protein
MSRLRVAPIVEGKGEVACIRILLERVWGEMLGGESIQVTRAFREPRGRLIKRDHLQRAVRSAAEKLDNLAVSTDPALVLILIDADEDCPGEIGPKLHEFAREANCGVEVACVVANIEYETWFAAAAESLSTYLDLAPHPPASVSPEEARHGKAWVRRRFRQTKYIEPKHQPAMTAAMSLDLCRERAPSFAKLYRELEKRLQARDASG